MTSKSLEYQKTQRMEVWISLLLKWGVLVCAGILSIGWILNQRDIIIAGLFILMSLPILRVALALCLFIVLKDYVYVFLSGMVLTILAAGFLMGRLL